MEPSQTQRDHDFQSVAPLSCWYHMVGLSAVTICRPRLHAAFHATLLTHARRITLIGDSHGGVLA